MNEFRQGWAPLLAATLGTMCGLLTISNYSQGFFVGPVTSELGWSVPQFFLAFTITTCLALFTAPFVGALAQKHGVRRLGILGLIGHAVGYVLLSLNTGSLTLWYLSAAALAVLGAGSLPIIWTSVLNGWFVKNRGKAIGITMAGTGMGAFLLPPIVEWLISSYGWRVAYRGVGLGALALSLPVVVLLFREKPAGPAREGDTRTTQDTWGLTRSQALRDYRFWLLCALLLMTIFVMVGLISNFERIMSARGVSRPDIATIAAAMGLTVVVGRLLVGTLVDYFWAPAVASVFFLFPVVAIVLMKFGGVDMGTGLAIGIAIGLAAGAELDMLAYLTGRYFGPAHYPAVFGCVFAVFSVGAGIAPALFGAGAAEWQGYDVVLSVAVGLLLLSIALFPLLGKYPQPKMVEASNSR